MGQMTLRLAGKYKIHKHDCKANYLFAVAASFLKDHLSIDLSYYQKAVEIGIQTGDLLFSGIALSRLSVNEFILGIKLDEIQKSSDFRFRVLHKGGSPFAFIEFFMQGLIRGLSDPTAESPCVLGQDENSEKGLIEAWEQANFGTGVTIYRFYKMQALYHFGKYEEALEEAEKGYAGLQFIATIIEEPIFLFFHVLCIAANYENMSQDAKNIYFELIGSHISRMKLWAEHCPANFEQLLCGMRAEKARLEGNNFKAMELYRKAINLSRKNAFINFEAIMCELAARFYHKAEFPRIARTFFTEAHYIYTLWGAHGKAQWLLAVYPDYIMYLNNRSVSSGSSTQTAKSTSNLSVFTGITQHETMDLASLMKSSQLISSEVRMEALLGNLLKVVMENAGAQKGYLMLVNQENVLRIQAESTSEKSVLVLQDKPLNSDAQLPVTLVRYCERTKTPFVTDDLSKENQFIKDNYVNTVKPLSALCVPVLNQGTLKAVIYLENSLITGAFNAKRITLVNLLVGQIATSLENALLYAGLEERVQARTHELNAANELLKVQHQRIADSIRYAQTMQNSILPTDEDLSGAFAEHFAIFRPKDVVSGDFYWYAHIGNQHILAVADCTGHGVPGAFMSMVGNSALDEIIKVKEITNPSLILDMLQNSIQEALRQRTRDGMDIAIMVCEQHDENTVKILFSAAKNSLLYWENNKIVRLKGTRRSLGGGASNTQTPFELHELFLPKGTQLYLTTDGFPDQCDSNRNSFKMARLIEMLESYQAFPLKEQARFFENTLNQFMGDEEQRDDITLIGLKL
jgi:serine phosphatase RsbU (regulator of sigma subunit)/tetratricopeptide (TPR) repeat protein